MELVLPVALQADVHVTRDSIGTLVLSIPTCSSIFSPASVLDGSNRYVPDTKAMALLLEFLIQASIQLPQRIKDTPSSHLFYDMAH